MIVERPKRCTNVGIGPSQRYPVGREMPNFAQSARNGLMCRQAETTNSTRGAGRSRSSLGRDGRPCLRRPTSSGSVNWNRDFTTSPVPGSCEFGHLRRSLTNTVTRGTGQWSRFRRSIQMAHQTSQRPLERLLKSKVDNIRPKRSRM